MSLPTPASPLEDVEQEAKTHPGIVILSKQKYVPLSGVLYLLSRAFEEGRGSVERDYIAYVTANSYGKPYSGETPFPKWKMKAEAEDMGRWD